LVALLFGEVVTFVFGVLVTAAAFSGPCATTFVVGGLGVIAAG
jgi:hypothetical protein